MPAMTPDRGPELKQDASIARPPIPNFNTLRIPRKT
jgi:hypothetical protein